MEEWRQTLKLMLAKHQLESVNIPEYVPSQAGRMYYYTVKHHLATFLPMTTVEALMALNGDIARCWAYGARRVEGIPQRCRHPASHGLWCGYHRERRPQGQITNVQDLRASSPVPGFAMDDDGLIFYGEPRTVIGYLDAEGYAVVNDLFYVPPTRSNLPNQ